MTGGVPQAADVPARADTPRYVAWIPLTAAAVGGAVSIALASAVGSDHASRATPLAWGVLGCGLALSGLLAYAAYASRRLVRAAERLAIHSAEETRLRTLFEGLFDSAGDAILVVDEAGRVCLSNPSATAVFGWSRQELEGRSVEDLVPAAQRPGHAVLRRAFMESPQPRPMGARMGISGLRRDGREFPAEISIAPIRIGGRPHAMATVRDVTELRRAEAAARQGAERYRSFFDGTPVAAYITLPEGPIVACNAVFARTFGFASIGDARRASAADLYADPASRRSVIDAVTRDGTAVVHGVDLRRADGSVFPASVSVAAVRDTEGRIIEFQGHVVDLSESRRLEEQVRRSQKLEALGRLAGGVAHDFNNLLTAISGNTELAMRRIGRADPAWEMCNDVLTTCARAAALTSQLLAFSRHQVARPTLLDPREVVTSMARMLRRIVGEDVVLEVTCAPDLRTVRADRTHLEQVVLNLAVNARDAMAEGGKLRIDVGHAGPPDVHGAPSVVLAVSDTGTGIDPAIRDQLFDPFFSTKPSGTGLGLSTVHGIVTQCGGRICVESEVGRGTTFRILLPEVPGQPEERPDIVAGEPAPASAAASVLVVEDDLSVRGLMRVTFEAQGYRVIAAESGQVALAAMDACCADAAAAGGEFNLDLLVTDVVMPHMGGRQLAAEIRRRFPPVSVLFVSGHAADSVLRDHLLRGDDQFLAKPFTPTVLAARAAAALRSRSAN